MIFSVLNPMSNVTHVERKDGPTNFKERKTVKKVRKTKVKMTMEKGGVNLIPHLHHTLRNGG